MNRVKVLFLIHDLGQGGAEKVLVNLVNNLDASRFDISLMALFGGGVNEQFLKPHVRYNTVFAKTIPGNSQIMKLLSPVLLHKLLVKEKYDIEISFLEGPTARVICGCTDPNVKKICWIHRNYFSMKELAKSFRCEKEALNCYESFDHIYCVSKYMMDNFCSWVPVADRCGVLYNTVESDKIRQQSLENAEEIPTDSILNMIAVGTLKEVKGFDRLLRIVNRLSQERKDFRLFILGRGPLEQTLKKYISDNDLADVVSFLGYKMNPYKYIAASDLYVCSSYSEGFSTAATEALIVGTPVCTVEVSGMKELLGDQNEYGIVTENDEDSLYNGLKSLLDNPELRAYYKEQSIIRGKSFSKDATVKAVEDMLLSL